jgi:hypothetical protein
MEHIARMRALSALLGTLGDKDDILGLADALKTPAPKEWDLVHGADGFRPQSYTTQSDLQFRPLLQINVSLASFINS